MPQADKAPKKPVIDPSKPPAGDASKLVTTPEEAAAEPKARGRKPILDPAAPAPAGDPAKLVASAEEAVAAPAKAAAKALVVPPSAKSVPRPALPKTALPKTALPGSETAPAPAAADLSLRAAALAETQVRFAAILVSGMQGAFSELDAHRHRILEEGRRFLGDLPGARSPGDLAEIQRRLATGSAESALRCASALFEVWQSTARRAAESLRQAA
jgi:hypothetical protein